MAVLRSFGSAIQIKIASTFYWPFTLEPVFLDLKSKFPLKWPKNYRRLCKSQGDSIGTHLDCFVAGQYL
jgi:hypothetical protein